MKITNEGLKEEAQAIRAELELLKWYANLLREAAELKTELTAISSKTKEIREEIKRPPTPLPTDEQAAHIVNAIKQVRANDPQLKSLVLNNCGAHLTAEYVAMLADGLSTNTHLGVLEMAHCQLSNESCRKLCMGIVANPFSVVRVMNLETNHITGDGYSAISTMLSKNATIAELKIANQLQPVGPAVEKELAAAIFANHSLTTCSVVLKDSVARKQVDDAIMRNKDELRKARFASPTSGHPSVTPPLAAAAAKPVEPAKAAPVAAAKPAEPVKPAPPAAAAVKPVEPVKPAPAPSKPVEPVKPAAAAVAPKPAEPVKPAPAMKPAEPVKAAPAPVATSPAKPTTAAPVSKPVATTPAKTAAATTPATPPVATPPAAATSPAAAAKSPEVPASEQKYTYDDLMKRPAGVDVKVLEKYLTDAEFTKALKMTREAYYKMPAWKQLNAKREAKLF